MNIQDSNSNNDRSASDVSSISDSHTPNDKSSNSTLLPSFLTAPVVCILITETAERFTYYGFRAILILYFTQSLKWEDDTAIAIYSYTISLAYGTPLLGAVVADAWLGKYATILSFGCAYALGLVILTLGAYLAEDGKEGLGQQKWLTLIGLFLICVGTGGIKPCVSAFGADQVTAKRGDADENFHDECGAIVRSDLDNNEDGLFQRLASTEPSTPGIVTNTIGERVDEEDREASDENLIRAYFAYFYFGINFGSVFSFVLVPSIRAKFGYGTAFLLPTIFIFIALLVFVSKQKEYVHHKPKARLNNTDARGDDMLITLKLFVILLCRKMIASIVSLFSFKQRPNVNDVVPERDREREDAHQNLTSITTPLARTVIDHRDENMYTLTAPNENYSQQQIQDVSQTMNTLPIMLFFPIFWMLYDQSSSAWTLQATKMNLHGIEPEQLGVVNPILIMIMIPCFDKGIYPTLERRHWSVSPLKRIACGMFLLSISFVMSGLLESAVVAREPSGEKISVLLQLPQITVLSIAEILVSITGLEFSYSQSPKSMKSLVMALYLIMNSIGDFIGGVLYSSVFQTMDMIETMYTCALIMFFNFVIFCFVAKYWTANYPP